MYYILETQYNNGQGSVLPAVTKQNRNEAQSEYYKILQYAAISSVQVHGAIILDELCMPIMYQSYDRRPKE